MTALELPDLPRWVEAHGMAADPAGWRRSLGGGLAVGHDQARLIVIAGEAERDAVGVLSREHPRHTLLVAIEREDLAASLRDSGRSLERAVLHTLADPDGLPASDGAAPLPPDVPLGHLRGGLADELEAVRRVRTIWSAWVDGQPVSFACAPWHSTAWFDISVDTVPACRQLGLGTIVVSAMIRHERAQGREPVWGAGEHNIASLRLAQRLGFAAVDELWVAPGAP